MANANWSNPTLTSTYTNFVSEVKNRDEDLALQFDGTTSTNIPTNAIRWDSSANRWKKWNGTSWAELATTYALTALSTTGTASIGGAITLTSGGTSTTPAVDNNSTNIATTAFVVGQAGSATPVMNGTAAVGTSLRYARQDHVHASDTSRAPSNNPTLTGTLTINGAVGYGVGGAVGTYDQIFYPNDGISNWFCLRNTGNVLLFGVGGTPGTSPSLALTASGAIGIGGITSPATAFGIPSSALMSWGVSNYSFIYGNSTAGNLVFGTQTVERARIDGNGRFILGSTSGTTFFNGAGANFQVQSTASNFGIGVEKTGADASPAYIVCKKTRSTSAAGNTTVNSGDELGHHSFVGADGTTGIEAASISAFVDATPGTSNMPGRLVFSTTASGASSPTERVRLDNLGYLTGTVNGLGKGIYTSAQYYRLNAALAGANVSTAQNILGVGVTLVTGTIYEFEGVFAFSKSAGTTSHTFGMGFGGTATLNNIGYAIVTMNSTTSATTLAASANSIYPTAATTTVLTAAITSAANYVQFLVKGTVSINAGGTFIPQYTLSAAPGGAYTTALGSYFKIAPLGASGANTSIGTWA